MEESCDFCFVILWITLYRNLLLILLEDAWLVWWVLEGNAKTLGITIKDFFFKKRFCDCFHFKREPVKACVPPFAILILRS